MNRHFVRASLLCLFVVFGLFAVALAQQSRGRDEGARSSSRRRPTSRAPQTQAPLPDAPEPGKPPVNPFADGDTARRSTGTATGGSTRSPASSTPRRTPRGTSAERTPPGLAAPSAEDVFREDDARAAPRTGLGSPERAAGARDNADRGPVLRTSRETAGGAENDGVISAVGEEEVPLPRPDRYSARRNPGSRPPSPDSDAPVEPTASEESAESGPADGNVPGENEEALQPVPEDTAPERAPLADEHAGAYEGPSDPGTRGQADETEVRPNGRYARPGAVAMPNSLDRQPSGLPAAPAGIGGDGIPGEETLAGPQQPSVVLFKRAPQEIQVGVPAEVEITARNNGSVPVHQVEIQDVVPRGMRLVDAEPQPSADDRGGLVWSLGTLAPGEEIKITQHLMPLEEGELGSVATIHFAAQATSKTRVTRPELKLDVQAPESALIGQKVPMRIRVTNVGTGAASGVVLEDNLPPGLIHEKGRELFNSLGTIRPNESRDLELVLTAERAGPVTNLVAVRGDGNLSDQAEITVDVLAPQLQVQCQGPARRYLDRNASYEITLSNPGTAPARRVELVAYLPPGLEFVSANNAGEYDRQTGAVHWLLEELPAGDSGGVTLVTKPTELGEQAIKVKSTAEMNLLAEDEKRVMVDGVAAILTQVADLSDPIEVGESTVYEIRVVNQGTKVATNVVVSAELPPEMAFANAEGPTQPSETGQRVTFEPLPKLNPKGETVYRITVKADRPGDLRMRVEVMTDDIRTPVVKEESTQVISLE